MDTIHLRLIGKWSSY